MKFQKIPTLVFLIFLPLLLALGFWQLDRAEQKRAWLEQQKLGLTAEVVRLSPATTEPPAALKFKRVEAQGRYDADHQFLLDNRISDGKVGYFVLTPFILEGSGKAVLVNRGWVPSGPDRTKLPDLRIRQMPALVKGRINSFPGVGIKLEGAETPAAGWPSTVQVANSDILSKRLGYPLFPFQIELDKDQPEGYRREWRSSDVMPPAQHVAYATQWFALAFLLSMLFVWFSRLKHDE
ncbi:SURF1 family protein [Methylosarcina fibrata]|uniref:SURF1 family protein n=1 Tax=Methylosarcina fibrata TaxID=105972 RepID=UPI000373F92C|nr:SURF1 family protein [Methylosarcina fibrata]